jgi:pyruvate/2-oxoglutarate dehydrogenase complex dihydrolipoamide acyltransferase (E2) component
MNERAAREIRVPQLGEGLREVRIVELLKNAGNFVRRGDALYTVETDKTTLELEAPFDGLLTQWLISPGDVIETNGAVALALPAAGEAQQEAADRSIPPRTRAYARVLNVSEDELRRLPAAGSKVMPSDIDAFLARVGNGAIESAFKDRPVSGGQRALIFRLRRSASLVIPASITAGIAWRDLVSRACMTPFQTFAYGIARTSRQHAKFRSVMLGDDTIREYGHVNLGLAVARPDDGLVIARIPKADMLDEREFVRTFFGQLRRSLKGQAQAEEDIQILLTHLGSQGVENAIPTLVSPASSIFFLGAPNNSGVANVTVTFDHRLMNGAAAARFLADLALNVRQG